MRDAVAQHDPPVLRVRNVDYLIRAVAGCVSLPENRESMRAGVIAEDAAAAA